MGKRKPEPDAFQAVADAIGVPLDAILFFDDTLENVQGARAVGMRAVHVRSGKDIEDAVAGFLT
jgi:putative hydrolase of the HAD superfamily